MVSASSGNGAFRRLSSSERLRSLPYPNRQIQARARSAPWKQQQTKGKGKKSSGVLAFAVLRCAEEQQENMKWDSMIANEMLLLNENDNEDAIRQSIIESLKSKFPMIGSNNFQLVKVRQRKSSILELGLGTEYSFAVVKKKKMAGQGVLYIRIKPGYEFLYEEDDNSSLEVSYLEKAREN